jgi:exonuclease VII small subunit
MRILNDGSIGRSPSAHKKSGVREIAKNLPDVPRHRVLKISEEANDANAITWSLTEALEQAEEEVDRLSALLQSHTDPLTLLRTGADRLGDDHPLVVQIKKDLDERRREYDHVNSRYNEASKKAAACMEILQKATDYVRFAGSGVSEL